MRVLAKNGMVASPHYRATEAGVRCLRRGGNAVDAAITVNAVLAVVTPYKCGIGGDLFAQIVTTGMREPIGLNASGRAPAAASRDGMLSLTADGQMPRRGPLSVTVPGCVDGWFQLHQRYGRLRWADLFEEAIQVAENGFPAGAEHCRAIETSVSIFHPDTPAASTFLPDGKVPREGDLVRQRALSATLKTLAQEGPRSFYEGSIGQEIQRSVQNLGGLLSTDDLQTHSSDWVHPLSSPYRDVVVYELPPNSQGMIALMTLSILQNLHASCLTAREENWVHYLAEASRLAYADRNASLTDPHHMPVTAEALLSDGYLAGRAASIGERATIASRGTQGDTAYFCTADSDGMLASVIQSNFSGIGSGVMAGTTGIMLHNRGASFDLDATHANVIAPRKRPMHTLMPGVAFKADRPWLIFGTMGGSMQAQIHTQLLSRLIDRNNSLDEAILGPRFNAIPEDGVALTPRMTMESRFSQTVIDNLVGRGNEVGLVGEYDSSMGHAQAIQVLKNGVYMGASDPRTEGLALGY